MPTNRDKLAPWLIFALILSWLVFLRWPYFDRPAWNLDEGIHATIARCLLDGGVMYRDAIDQRTPLTYYLVAGVFSLFGENNMVALHAFLTVVIAVTAFGLLLIGDQWKRPWLGPWAAASYCALSFSLLYIGDSLSFSTEWLVALFTTWSTWYFWKTWDKASHWPFTLCGFGFAAAFLSKQPGLLDFGAPLATLIYLAANGKMTFPGLGRRLLAICLGFVVSVALTFSYFWLRGAGDDLYFYAWTYNLNYYGPEASLNDRVMAALAVAPMLWQRLPALALAALGAITMLVVRLVQFDQTQEKCRQNPSWFYLLVWVTMAWLGAASSGRVYGHYYIQMLPPLALTTAAFFAWALDQLISRGNLAARIGAGIVVVFGLGTLIAIPLRGPWPNDLPEEIGTQTAAFVRDHSQPEDKIFVWGYSPDFYVLADRRPASRFIYCSFITGLIPWTNIQPGRDTTYAVVPGTQDTLLHELNTNRPEFFIDTSPAGYRSFTKYPLGAFPRLDEFVLSHYVEVEPSRFPRDNFKIYLIKDSFRPVNQSVDRSRTIVGELRPPEISGPALVDPVVAYYTVEGRHSGGQLTGLELLVDGQPVDSITFQPTERMTARFQLDFGILGAGPHNLIAKTTDLSGQIRMSRELSVECAPPSLPRERLPEFGLQATGERLIPSAATAPYGAKSRLEAGRLVFAAHAPSTLRYPFKIEKASLRGRFGFRDGAWSVDNPSRTDGAEFRIRLISKQGDQTMLLQRTLRPTTAPSDRGEQSFEIQLPDFFSGFLEFEITNGPDGNPVSDWTYWSDLLLVNSG